MSSSPSPQPDNPLANEDEKITVSTANSTQTPTQTPTRTSIQTSTQTSTQTPTHHPSSARHPPLHTPPHPLPPGTSPPTQPTRLTLPQKLKSALWLHLARLSDRTTLSLSKNSTPQFIGALTELVWAQLAEASKDSEEFARHAGRTTVTTADVMLLARRNEALKGVLEGWVGGLRGGRGVRYSQRLEG